MDQLYQQLIALAQVVFIDLVLAGDNAVVVGMAASKVPAHMRRKVVIWGVAGAVVLRILFAVVTTYLLAIVGLTLAGGILLLWVCWKMYRDIREHNAEEAPVSDDQPSTVMNAAAQASFFSALVQIVIADVSMSLDNVLAVAGVAKGHVVILVIGLTLAVVLMGVAASYIARLLVRYPWISWIGLLIILHVALDMIWRGSHEVTCQFVSPEICEGGLLSALGALLF